MRPKSLVLLALALGCGLIASIGISQVLDGSNKPAMVETAPIYVALQNVNVGDPITDAMVSLEEWPKDKVPPGAITTWDELEDRRPRTNIFKGEPILDTKLLAKGEINDPIQGIPDGMRLKTISVDARKSAAGLLSPGDRVDVQIYVRRNEQEGVLSPFTKIFLQNIRVYAVDQTVDKSIDGAEARNVAKTVSLVVTPQQANRITLAENLGEISLIPRNPDDETVVDDHEQDIDALLNPSTANNREKEQLASTSGRDNAAPSAIESLKAFMEAAVQRSQIAADDGSGAGAPPPFEMEIVYPTEVEVLQFIGGRPVKPNKDGTVALTPFVAPAPASSAAPAAPGEASPLPADFPIDLQVK